MKQSFTCRLLSCLCMIAVLSVMACSIDYNEAEIESANENEHANHVVILATVVFDFA